MLQKIKSVSLISKTNKSYIDYCKTFRESRNINRSETIPDRKSIISKWIEQSLNNLLSQQYIRSENNIITWLELTPYGIYSKRYKEIDGFYKTNEGYLLLEVKCSISKSSYTKGKSQINTNLELISKIYPNTLGILALADCRYFDSELGYALDKVIEIFKDGNAYCLLEGLEFPKH